MVMNTNLSLREISRKIDLNEHSIKFWINKSDEAIQKRNKFH